MVYKVASNAIEIAASPARVREVFLDFAKLPEWHSAHIRSIEIVSTAKKALELKKGDKLRVVLKGMSFSPSVLENSPNKFEWRGSIPYIVNGDHSFEFHESKTTPGGTTFVQYENFSGLLSHLAFSSGPKEPNPGFDALNQDLKKRVESLG